MEDVAMGNSYFRVVRDTVLMHRNYWNGETIDSFWSGESFSFADAGQGLSYQLAEILFRNLMSDYPKQIVPFLKLANYADAGDAALRDTCGVSLSDRVAQFLGSGPWAPRTDYGESTSEAGP